MTSRPGLGLLVGFVLALSLGYAHVYSMNGIWPVVVWMAPAYGWATICLVARRRDR